ncbi:hypothetical protein KM043_002041 [Ampulex compressa]|nr:hypothetical protein KM043_002041 [Ampulex compressa]
MSESQERREDGSNDVNSVLSTALESDRNYRAPAVAVARRAREKSAGLGPLEAAGRAEYPSSVSAASFRSGVEVGTHGLPTRSRVSDLNVRIIVSVISRPEEAFTLQLRKSSEVEIPRRSFYNLPNDALPTSGLPARLKRAQPVSLFRPPRRSEYRAVWWGKPGELRGTFGSSVRGASPLESSRNSGILPNRRGGTIPRKSRTPLFESYETVAGMFRQ